MIEKDGIYFFIEKTETLKAEMEDKIACSYSRILLEKACQKLEIPHNTKDILQGPLPLINQMYRNWSFSISHNAEFCVVAINKSDRNIGVDLENKDRELKAEVFNKVVQDYPTTKSTGIREWTQMEALYKTYCQKQWKAYYEIPHSLKDTNIEWKNESSVSLDESDFVFTTFEYENSFISYCYNN